MVIEILNSKGPRAASLKKKKYEILQRFKLPENALGGSLVLTHRKCGKSYCHCANGEGHPMWSLTFMVDGKKQVERISTDHLDEIKLLVAKGNEFKSAINELCSINAQLLSLWRKQNSKLRFNKKK